MLRPKNVWGKLPLLDWRDQNQKRMCVANLKKIDQYLQFMNT